MRNSCKPPKGNSYPYALLSELSCIQNTVPIMCIVDDMQVFNTLPYDEKDVSVDFILTPTKILEVKRRLERPQGLDSDGRQGVIVTKLMKTLS